MVVEGTVGLVTGAAPEAPAVVVSLTVDGVEVLDGRVASVLTTVSVGSVGGRVTSVMATVSASVNGAGDGGVVESRTAFAGSGAGLLLVCPFANITRTAKQKTVNVDFILNNMAEQS
jgi:hypothetical protein